MKKAQYWNLKDFIAKKFNNRKRILIKQDSNYFLFQFTKYTFVLMQFICIIQLFTYNNNSNNNKSLRVTYWTQENERVSNKTED